MRNDGQGSEGAPSIRRLRITSGIALALLPVLFMLAFGLVLDDALNGESTLLFDVGTCMFAGSGALGLAVLLVPARALDRRARIALLVAQCGLMPVAVALAAVA